MHRTSRSQLLAFAVAVVAIAATAGAAVLRSGGEPSVKKTVLELHLRTDGGTDAIAIDDLHTLAAGESRDYATASGKPVTVTRDDDGYALELDGKTIRIGGEGGPHGSGHGTMKMRQIDIEGGEGGDTQRIVLSGEPGEKRVIVHRSHDGAGGFAFTTDEKGPHSMLSHHGLLARIEKSEKFLALDAVTQEIVRDLVRDAATPFTWVGAEGAEGDHAVEVWIERREPGDDEQ